MLRRHLAQGLLAALLSLFYGVIAAGQVLGLLRAYHPVLVVPLSVILVGVAWAWYTAEAKREPWPLSWRWDRLSPVFLAVGVGIFVALVLLPLIRWPFSPVTRRLPWDAGLYHFPKAIEMIVTRSAWDLSIDYGEYPFGYESLLALAFLLNPQGYGLGVVHALIALFFFLGITLLIARRTRLPLAVVLLLVSVMLVSKRLAPHLDANLWWVFWPQLVLVGKNDVLLAAATLAMLLHAPITEAGPFPVYGLAMATMIALSVKPNSVLIAVVAWGLMGYWLWRADLWKAYRIRLGVGSLLVLPGVLWAGRNLLVQGRLLSPVATRLFQWSIARNVTNPYFYRYVPQHLWLVLSVLTGATLLAFWRRSWWPDVIVGWALLVSFALTPASAFSGSTQTPTQIAWRFGMALLAYVFLWLWMLFEPVGQRLYRWVTGSPVWMVGLAGVVLLFGGWAVWTQRALLETSPDYARVLRDQYPHPVGVDGYYSAYDYVQRNVHHAVVIVENGLPFYLYDRPFTNSVTRARPADYLVYLQTPWLGQGGYPPELEMASWAQQWELVYEDAEGRVYRRR